MTFNRHTHKSPGSWLLCLVVCCLAVSSVKAQDAVKLTGFWIQPVRVISITGGEVQYQTETGATLSRPIEELQGLRLERYPALGTAFQALLDQDQAEAAKRFRDVYDNAKEPWVRGYVGQELIGVYSNLGNAGAATAVYVDLVTSGAEPAFTNNPPTEAVSLALPEEKKQLLALLEAARIAAGPQRGKLIEPLIDAARLPVDATGGNASTTSNTQPTTTNGKAPAVVLSASVPPGPVANLIKSGRYDEAIAAADRAMGRPGRTASLLYLKGLARLGIAERDQDPRAYKSAGLEFMRVRVYFPRSGVLGPATLETGYVHQKIGRPDIAKRLYEACRPMIHPQEDPACYQRLAELTRALDENESDD